MSTCSLCLGIDFGATKVRAVAIERTEHGVECRAEESRVYAREVSFRPLSLELQAEQCASPLLSEAERALGGSWIDAAAACVDALASERVFDALVLGVAAPGRKTADGRGTSVVRNGPRIPDLLTRLLERLGESGSVSAPLGRVLGDGECSVWGEVASASGALRGTTSGYYLGGGTGLAEAAWSDGAVHPCEPLAWQLEAKPGVDFESLLGMDAIKEEFGEFPEKLADAGDPAAPAVFGELARRLASLLGTRASSDPEVIVLGQHFGEWFLRDDLSEVFREPLLRALRESTGERTANAVRGSRLRAAPAIGCAWLAHEERLTC